MKKKIFGKSSICAPLLLAAILVAGGVSFANERVTVPVIQDNSIHITAERQF